MTQALDAATEARLQAEWDAACARTAALRVGDTVRIYYGRPNINNRTVHVRGFIDDCQVVLRQWSPRKGWRYEVQHYYEFGLRFESGWAKVTRRGKR